MTNTPKADSALRLMGVCLDCADAKELADFYGRLLGWEITAGGDDWFNIRDPRAASD